jgi:hypothetical protein
MAGSKKGAATDLAVDELRAQFLQFQSEIQKRLDEDAEKHQRKEAQLQDLIVNTIIENFKTVREQFIKTVHDEVDERFNRFAIRHENILGEGAEKGSRSEGVDLQRRDFRTSLPRADFPVFTGDNPVRKCRSYFDIHQVPEEYKTRYATLYFQDRADECYGVKWSLQGYEFTNDFRL